MNLQQEKYDVIEIFEENANQLILLAIENTHYEGVVIINKITKSSVVNSDMLKAYKEISSSIININETEEQVIIINSYKDTQLLSDYLIENTLDFKERIRLAKSFLSQISKYAVFSYPIQQILLHSDQLTIRNDVLIFSDYIFLENYDENCTQTMLLAEISKILKIILQLHKEALSNEMATLNQFLDTLDSDVNLSDYNKLYNEFKVLAANLDASEEIIHYTDLSTLDTSKSDAPKVDLDYIKNKKQIRLARSNEDTLEVPKLELPNNEYQDEIEYQEEIDFDLDASSLIEYDVEQLTNLGINPNFSEDFDIDDEAVELITGETKSVDEVLFDENDILEDSLFAPTESFDNNNITAEIMSILDDLDISDKKDETQPEDHDALLDNLLTDSLFESWLDKEDDLSLVEIENEAFDDADKKIVEDSIFLEDETLDHLFNDKLVTEDSRLKPIIDEIPTVLIEKETIDEDFNQLLTSIESPSINDLELNDIDLLSTPELPRDNVMLSNLVELDLEDTQEEETEIPIEDIVKNIESLLEKDLSTVRDFIPEVEGFGDFREEIDAELKRLDETPISNDTINLIDNSEYNLDKTSPYNGSVEIKTNQENAVDHISDILNRNDKEHSNLFITNDKRKSQTSYYVPSFLAFFISLLIITTLLLYYTSTYI